jgi:hypothetical protein
MKSTVLQRPEDWTDEDRERVERALAEHRLSRVDLFLWREIDIEGRSPYDVAQRFLLQRAEIEHRLDVARARLESTFSRPWQEAYLGQWLNT